MVVGNLKEALKNIPDDMEICIELFENQHECRDFGLALPDSDGVYHLTENKDEKECDEYNFLIVGY